MSSSETFVHESYPGKSRFCFVLKYLAQQKKIKDNGIWDTYLAQRLKLQPMLLIETLKSLPAGLEGKIDWDCYRFICEEKTHLFNEFRSLDIRFLRALSFMIQLEINNCCKTKRITRSSLCLVLVSVVLVFVFDRLQTYNRGCKKLYCFR